MEKIELRETEDGIEFVGHLNYDNESFISILLEAGNPNGKDIDLAELRKSIEATLSRYHKAPSMENIIFIIKTIFRDYDEKMLTIRAGEEYQLVETVKYEDGILKVAEGKFNYLGCEEISSSYKRDEGLNFSVTDRTNGLIANTFSSDFGKEVTKITKKIDTYIHLKGKSYLLSEEQNLSKAFLEFYGELPDFRNQDHSQKAQMMIYLLQNYGVYFPEYYNYSLSQGSLSSLDLRMIILELKPFGIIEEGMLDTNFPVYAEGKITGIGELVREYISQFPGSEMKALTTMTKILYAKKNISPNLTIDEMAAALNCAPEEVLKYIGFVEQLETSKKNR